MASTIRRTPVEEARAAEPALFDDAPPLDAPPAPAPADAALRETAKAMPPGVRLGTSTWSFPGWRGIVYAPSSGERRLAADGLAAYSRYPIFRTVGLDRNFYRALSADAYAVFAEQVPEDFRFLVKAPREVTDPYLRTAAGRPRAPNPHYLDAALAATSFLAPAAAGLGDKAGPLVFQFSPYPHAELRTADAKAAALRRIGDFFEAVRALPAAAGRLLCAEFRNYEFLTPRGLMMLRDCGIRPVIGLHPAMPGARRQMAALRFYETGVRTEDFGGSWRLSGPLVIRWSLAAHQFFDTARRDWAPYSRIVAADPATRALLAALIVRAAESGVESYMVANNKAEGCAPKTMRAIAEQTVEMWRAAKAQRAAQARADAQRREATAVKALVEEALAAQQRAAESQNG